MLLLFLVDPAAPIDRAFHGPQNRAEKRSFAKIRDASVLREIKSA
jgi:hypothetical protein